MKPINKEKAMAEIVGALCLGHIRGTSFSRPHYFITRRELLRMAKFAYDRVYDGKGSEK